MSAESTPPSGPHMQSPGALPPGTRLGEFEMLRVLGVGGFGIVYLALRPCARARGGAQGVHAGLAGGAQPRRLHVSLRSQSDAETFALGLRSFVNEARLLARFDHPSLVKVYRFWEANGTAYMVMPLHARPHAASDVRQAMAAPPDEAWLRALLDAAAGRARAAAPRRRATTATSRPTTSCSSPTATPVLLDFGAARRVIGDMTQALTAILKPGYAPIEQYAEAGVGEAGAVDRPLCAGRDAALPAAGAAAAAGDDTRRARRDAEPLAEHDAAGLQRELPADHRLDAGAAPADRPQSVAALRARSGRPRPCRRAAGRAEAQPASQWEQTMVQPHPATTAAAHRATTMPRSVLPPPPRRGDSGRRPGTAPGSRHRHRHRHRRMAATDTAALASPAAKPRSRLVPVVLGVAALGVAAASSCGRGRLPAPWPSRSRPPRSGSGGLRARFGGPAQRGRRDHGALGGVAPGNAARRRGPQSRALARRRRAPPSPRRGQRSTARHARQRSSSRRRPRAATVTRRRPATGRRRRRPTRTADGRARIGQGGRCAHPSPSRPSAAEAGRQGPAAKCSGRNPLSYFGCMSANAGAQSCIEPRTAGRRTEDGPADGQASAHGRYG